MSFLSVFLNRNSFVRLLMLVAFGCLLVGLSAHLTGCRLGGNYGNDDENPLSALSDGSEKIWTVTVDQVAQAIEDAKRTDPSINWVASPTFITQTYSQEEAKVLCGMDEGFVSNLPQSASFTLIASAAPIITTVSNPPDTVLATTTPENLGMSSSFRGSGRDKILAQTSTNGFSWTSYQNGRYLTPVKNQGPYGTCVAFAVTAALEMQWQISNWSPGQNTDLSEWYLWFNGTKKYSGAGNPTPPNPGGWYPSYALMYLLEDGTVDEAQTPYTGADSFPTFTEPPANSAKFNIENCYCFQSADWIKFFLRKSPIVAMMPVYSDFYYYSGGVYKHLIGDLVGYHCVTIVGYNEADKCWICKNSWSDRWGENGYFRIAYGELYKQDGTNEIGFVPLQPLRVTYTSPARGQTFVETRPWISFAVGDSIIDWRNINNTRVRVTGPGNTQVAGKFYANRSYTNLVYFYPDSNLQSGTEYKVTLAKGLADYFWEALPNDVSWTFTTTGGPSLKIGTPSVDLTATGPVTFPISFVMAESISLSPAQIAFTSTGDAKASVRVEGSSLDTRTIVLEDITGNGTLQFSLAQGVATNRTNILSASVGPSSAIAVDTAPPQVALASMPTNPTAETSVNIAVSGPGLFAYRYSIDGQAFGPESPASTPLKQQELSIGKHSLAVIGRDLLGNWNTVESAASFSWLIGTPAGKISLKDLPPALASQTFANVLVEGPGVIAYKFKINDQPFSSEFPTTERLSLSSLTSGTNLLVVIGCGTDEVWQSEQTGTTYSWSIDLEPTAAIILNVPTATQTSAQIAIGGTDVQAYRYKVDGGDWSSMEIMAQTPILLANLAEGQHTISIIARDSAGNWQSTDSSTSFSWTTDTTPKIAVLANTPVSITNQTGAAITVGGTGVVKYAFQIDSSAWSTEVPVATSLILSALSEGEHTLHVIGIDALGNIQARSVATVFTWTIDTTPKIATLVNTPSNPTNQTAATITVGGASVVNYSYQLDAGAWSPETSIGSSLSLSDLVAGEHTLKVVGIDAAGNRQAESSATVFTWTIDTTPKIATLVNTPPNPTNQTGATITIGGAGVVNYSYQLDAGAWSPETSISTLLSLSGLVEGEHSLRVIGIDAVGNVQTQGAATVLTWVIDTTAPTVLLTNTPPNPTNQTTTNISVGAAGVVAYKYKLNGAAFSTSEVAVGETLALSGLANAVHTLSVIGRDQVGNWQSEANATVFTWTVDSTAVTAVLTTTPSVLTNQTNANITVGGIGATHYKFKLDSGTWGVETPVANAIALSGLAGGVHNVFVIARNALGTWQAEGSATQFTWTVDLSTPNAPNLAGSTPTNNQKPSWSWTSGGGGGNGTYRYKLDDNDLTSGSTETTTANFTPASNLTDAAHTLYVQERNAAGTWSNSGSLAITVDTSAPNAPNVTGTTPTNNPKPTWTWTSSGGGGNGTYRYKLDDNDLTSGSTETTTANFTPASNLTAAAYTLYVQERNAVGTWSNSGSLVITVVGSISSISTIAHGAVDPTVVVTLANAEFNNDASATTVENYTLTADTTGLTLASVVRDSAIQATLSFTGTSAAGTLQVVVKGAATTAVSNTNAVSITVAGSPAISSVSTIAHGAVDPTVVVTLANAEFNSDGSAIAVGNYTITADTTGLTLVGVVRDSTTQVTLSFTGTSAAGSLQVIAKGAATTAVSNTNAVSITVAGSPAISSVSTIAHGAVDPTVVVTLANAEFNSDGSAIAVGNYTITADTTGLTLASVVRDSATQVTLSFNGTSAAGTLQVVAKGAATSAVSNTNAVNITVDPVPGTKITHTVGSVDFKVSYAPAATFPTGFDDSGENNVANAFWIGETEVTYELWYAVRQWAIVNGYTFQNAGMEGSVTGGGTSPAYTNVGQAPTAAKNEPVTMVSWRDSVVWCNALSEKQGMAPIYRTAGGGIIRSSADASVDAAVATANNGFRLPTEWEWELAARWKNDSASTNGSITNGGRWWTPGTYASGATADYNDIVATQLAAWYTTNSGSKTQNVAAKPSSGNALGLYDMSGNVGEYCWDIYNTSSRVLRGGGWDAFAGMVTVSYRSVPNPYSAHYAIGFRVVRP